jgi:hypothetical protein
MESTSSNVGMISSLVAATVVTVVAVVAYTQSDLFNSPNGYGSGSTSGSVGQPGFGSESAFARLPIPNKRTSMIREDTLVAPTNNVEVAADVSTDGSLVTPSQPY